MLYKKNIQTFVNLDPETMYSGDLSEVVLEWFRREYEGRCSNDCFVMSIEKIVRQSDCSMDKNSLLGHGTVSATALANVLEYNRGCILPDVSYKQVNTSSFIIGDHGNMDVKVVKNADFVGMSAGDVFPVKIRTASYNKGSKRIIIVGEIFVPPLRVVNKLVVWSELNSTQKNCIRALSNEIKRYRSEITQKADKTVILYFVSMFYPYRGKSRDLPSDYEMADMLSLCTKMIEGGDVGKVEVWCRHPHINLYMPGIGVKPHDQEPDESGIELVPTDAYEVLTTYLMDYKEFLNMFHHYTTIMYPDEASTEINRKIWNMYKKNVKID